MGEENVILIKSQIFDIIKSQDNLQKEFRILEERKQALLKELNEAEKKEVQAK